MTSTRTVSVGKIGFVFKGKYNASATYEAWDCVLYHNSVYLCIQDATAGLLEDTTYFNIISSGLYYRGTYDTTATYKTNDIVELNSLAYVALEDGITGTFDSTKWFRLPSYVRNISFGVGNRYTAIEADNDIVALWNLIDGSTNSLNGSQTEYGMTELSAGSPIVSLGTDAPSIDVSSTYLQNTSTVLSRTPYMNIPSLALTDGDSITISFLKWVGATTSYTYLDYISNGISGTTDLTSGSYGLYVSDNGSSIYVYLTYLSGSSIYTTTLCYTSGTFVTNSLNDVTITIQRDGTNYITTIFLNGTLLKTTTVSNSNDITFTQNYIGYTTSSYLQQRGLVQMAVYSGVKYTANYTPEYVLLKKTI